MLSNKPYLIRAFYEWIVDSACTPFIVMDATFPRCKVPQEYIENGQIVLNIAPQAIRDFKVTNELVEFKASFSGVVHIISAPVKAVLAVYAQENGQGMFFDFEEQEESGTGTSDWVPAKVQQAETAKAKDTKKAAHLKLVE